MIKQEMILKYTMAFIFAMLVSLTGHAQQGPDKAMAMEYLTLSKTEDSVNETINEFDNQLFNTLSPKEREAARKTMEQVMGWEATKDDLAQLIMSIYTKEELEASIAFLRTPLGASSAAKGGEFSKQFVAVMTKKLKPALQKCCENVK